MALAQAASGQPAPTEAIAAQQAPPAQPPGSATPQASPSPQAQPAERQEPTAYTLPPEKYEQAIAYSRAQYGLHFISAGYGMLILLVLLAWRVGPRFRDWAERASSRRLVQAAIYAPLLLLTLAVLELPTGVYGQWLSLRYDQSVQSWPSWAWDWLKGQLLSVLFGTFLVWLLYGVIRRSPRRWWLYFWLLSLPIVVFVTFLVPVVIEPLFFEFEPLAETHPALVAEIDRVARRGGLEIPPERTLLMKASEKLNSVNAYVSGFGASQRVVVWDTTLARLTPQQTLFVFGHEMGHYVLNHIPQTIVVTAAVLLGYLYLGYRGLRWALARWGGRWGIRGADDWAALPVLLLLLSVFTFLASPVFNAYSRYKEHEADVYALEVLYGIVPDLPEVAAGAFQILGETNLADPSPPPFIAFWLYSHPPLAERIAFARTYAPRSRGQRPERGK